MEKIVVFLVGGELFGIDITFVKEIVKYQKLTPMPDALPFVSGIMDLRGDVIPVIDLAKRFNMPETLENKRLIIVIELKEGLIFGLKVERVEKVVSVGDREIVSDTPGISYVKPEFISTIAKVGDDLVTVIDPSKIFSREELEALRGNK